MMSLFRTVSFEVTLYSQLELEVVLVMNSKFVIFHFILQETTIPRDSFRIMASTLPETPSSLQEQCLQYLIDHLEGIPVEALALLPTAIRRTLAVHLPVADILQLEQTRFASGLDMPGVWKEVCEIRHLLTRYPNLVQMFKNEIRIEAKEFVMMVVTYEALHPQQEKPHFQTVPPIFQAKRVCHLQDHANPPSTSGPPHLHVPNAPVIFSRVCFEDPFRVPQCALLAVPSRFVSMQQNFFVSGVLKLLSPSYHICLKRLYIDCSYCSYAGIADVVDVILPQLKQLTISCMDFENSQNSYFKLVHSLLSGCSHCLHTLTLDDCPHEAIEKIVSTVVSVFIDNPVNMQSLRHFCVIIYPLSEVMLFVDCCSMLWAEFTCSVEKALITLCKAIQTYTSLHSCSLRRFPVIGDHIILNSILPLFKQPQFQCLTLAETSLSLENIDQIVHKFLTTPCNEPQTLKLECIKVHGTDHNIVSSVHDSSFLLYKSLVLDCRIISHSSSYRTRVQSSLKKWLCTICKLQLHSLTVTNDYSQ